MYIRDDYPAIIDAKRRDLLRFLAAAQATAVELQQDLASDPSFRNQVVEASRKVTQTLQTPVDRAWELFFHSAAPTALLVSINADWLSLINDTNASNGYTNQEITIDQIARSNSSDVDLVQRLMRVLTSAGLIRETQPHQYAPTPVSKLFDNPGWADGLRHSVRDFSMTMTSVPEYLAEHKYQTPTQDDGIYQHVHGIPFFERLKREEEVRRQFANFMDAMRTGEKPWYEMYPVAERLQVSSVSDVLLVDIGGSKGHDLLAFSQFRKKLGLQGKLVLQDRPAVLSQVPLSSHDIEIQAHDFFEAQPVIGAKAYFLKHILHDWMDRDCVSILGRVRDAMEVGYSRLLISERMVPDRECSPRIAAFDVLMMVVVGGRERTTSEWKGLIAAVEGLEIEKIWTFGNDNDSVIEAVRKF